MSAVRFHADEHISSAVVDGLRRRGIDVTTTHQAGLAAAIDYHQLAHATVQRRVLITQDADFLGLVADGHPHCGIAYFRQGETASLILRQLVLLHGVMTAEQMDGHVEFL